MLITPSKPKAFPNLVNLNIKKVNKTTFKFPSIFVPPLPKYCIEFDFGFKQSFWKAMSIQQLDELSSIIADVDSKLQKIEIMVLNKALQEVSTDQMEK